ncbi:tyrosine-type recombinase/integrase [Undibacterium sp. SXout20W]|uniref:tyrosine-type recombinase/integrase n=1 Tax=Undibacterium sp. SXout20W TaxID=3413051 RepID=UPI003BF44A44
MPIHPRLNVIVKYLPFSSSRICLQRIVRRAMDKAGFNHMHFHDLRHSAASMLINNDVDLFTVGAILGHKDQRRTKRYSHLATETLTKAIFKIR